MSVAGLNPTRDRILHTNIHVSAQPIQYLRKMLQKHTEGRA